MKKRIVGLLVFYIMLLAGCGDSSKKDTPEPSKEHKEIKKEPVKEEPKAETASAEVPASERVDLKSKGIGPIKSLKLDAEINQELAAKGADVFKKMCTACHRENKRFVGPSPQNILERRSPEWIMNMILNPEEMVKKDPLAKELLIEYNGSPMANQNLSEDDARAVLEYFRTLK
ncbi:MAG: cytochrome c [Flavobacteriaceae bacterium]|nr:cytochrome c [Flavobacteriaceae bacterium]